MTRMPMTLSKRFQKVYQSFKSSIERCLLGNGRNSSLLFALLTKASDARHNDVVLLHPSQVCVSVLLYTASAQ